MLLILRQKTTLEGISSKRKYLGTKEFVLEGFIVAWEAMCQCHRQKKLVFTALHFF